MNDKDLNVLRDPPQEMIELELQQLQRMEVNTGVSVC